MRRIILLLAALAARTALASQPTITQEPADIYVPLGGTAVFGAQASGSGPLSFQWEFNGTNLSQNIYTVAGNGTSGDSGDGGPATNAAFMAPYGLAVDDAGNFFFSDPSNSRIRKVSTNGVIITICGTGTPADSGDGGPATNAAISYPHGVAVDKTGNVFIADPDFGCVRKIGTNGIITTVAGNGNYGHSGDGGPATAAALDGTGGLSVDGAGNLFIADYYQNCVRKVDSNGIITTVAGNGDANFYGDGGAATNAALNAPTGVAADAAGNLYIADNANNRIRKVATNGVITTVAGNGTAGYAGNGGAATNAALRLTDYCGLAVDSAGNLFITDVDNNCIRRLAPNGVISTVTGNATNGFAGDGGPATNAALSGPRSIAVNSLGRIFIADSSNNRVREFGDSWLPVLSLKNISAGQQGTTYSVVVTNSDGSVTSRSARLTVVLPIKSFTQKVSGANLKIEITGPANFTYILQSAAGTAQPVTWQPVITNSADATGYWSYTITNFAASPTRFFRMAGQ